jgi:hypothetical protein
VQAGWEREVPKAGKQTECGDGGVEVESGGEADRGEESEDLGGWDLQEVGQRVTSAAEARIHSILSRFMGLPKRCAMPSA